MLFDTLDESPFQWCNMFEHDYVFFFFSFLYLARIFSKDTPTFTYTTISFIVIIVSSMAFEVMKSLFVFLQAIRCDISSAPLSHSN